MIRYRRTATKVYLALAVLWHAAHAGPPPPESRPAPGTMLQENRTRNLGPYITTTSYGFGPGTSYTSVSWYNKDGTLRRELAGPTISPNSGFVSDYSGVSIIHGLFEDWRIEVPKKPGRPGFINATPDSLVFHHNYHPQDRMIAVDVYLHGELVGTVGPFHRYRAEEARLSREGAAALLTRESADGAVQVVVFDEKAQIRFMTPCDDPVLHPAVAPGVDGVLLEANTGEQPRQFTFYKAAGKVRSLGIGPNARLLDWVPGTHQTVFETSVGYDHRYRLVDWDTGETRWDIADPCPRVNPVARSVIALRDYVLTCGAEYIYDEHPVTIPTLYAIGEKSGEVVARWRPNFGPIVSYDGGGLFPLQGKLYFVSEHYVSEVQLDDIASKKNGWE